MEKGVPCRHLWAAILAAEEEGYLSEVVSATEVTLDMDDFFDEIPKHVGRRVSLAGFPVSKRSEVASMPPPRHPEVGGN